MSPGVALVTGAGGRLGRVMAVALGEDGWKVGVHYGGSKEGAEETCALIGEAGGIAAALHADLTGEASREALMRDVAAELGAPVTLLVNSAATFENDSAQTHSRETWDHHIETNLRAPVHLSQLMVNALKPGTRGAIVNLIDQRVWKLNPTFFTYTLSKAALWQATQTLAQAFAPYVRVNGIGPGPTLRSVHQSAEEFAGEQAATLTGQGSSPQEIVRALRYLVAADSVTGQMIASDGGQHLIWQTPDMEA